MDNSGLENETISFSPDYDKTKVKHITLKYSTGYLHFKARVPTFDEGTAEAMLSFMHEFNETASKIGYITT